MRLGIYSLASGAVLIATGCVFLILYVTRWSDEARENRVEKKYSALIAEWEPGPEEAMGFRGLPSGVFPGYAGFGDLALRLSVHLKGGKALKIEIEEAGRALNREELDREAAAILKTQRLEPGGKTISEKTMGYAVFYVVNSAGRGGK